MKYLFDANIFITAKHTMPADERYVKGVGAMDVSRSEAQRAETNAIARSDDRATITDVDVEPTITERHVKGVGRWM
jgi:predicted nuclease of predicted toxin-antitoxin system